MKSRFVLVALAMVALGSTLAAAAELGHQHRIASVGPATALVDVAPDGSDGHRLVVWAVATDGAGSEVYARVVGARGRPRGPVRRVSNMPTGEDRTLVMQPAAAYNGGREEYVVVWAGAGKSEASAPCQAPPGFPGPIPDCVERDVEVYMRRIDADGRPLGAQRRISSTGPHDCTRCQAIFPRIAYDPHLGRYLVAFLAQADPDRPTIRVQRLMGNGTEAPARERDVTEPKAWATFGMGDLVYEQADRIFVLLHASGRTVERGDVYTMRLNPQGKPFGRRRAISAGEESRDTNPRLALNPSGRRMVAVWEVGAVGQPEQIPVARALNGSGSPRGRIVTLPEGDGGVALQPAVAWDTATQRFAVAWSRSTDSDREIYATFAGTEATPAFSEAVRVSHMGPDAPPGTPNYIDWASFPRLVMRDQGGFLSVWYGYEEAVGGGGVYVRSVTP